MDENLREVFQCAGCALLSVQFMEKELACLLLIPQMAKLNRCPSEDEIRKVIDTFDRMTFGQLIRKLEELGEIGEISDKLQEALNKRNRLAHHFFEAYRNKLHSSDTQEVMKEELSGMKSLFDEIFDGLNHVNFRLMKAVGICTETGDLIQKD